LSLSDQLNKIVLETSELQKKYFRHVDSWRKDDRSVVTDADIESEALLRSNLMKLIPDAAFVGEEGGWDDNLESAEYHWVVDPIDGTSSFVAGLPVWGISVALLKNREPFMASLYFPIIDEMYYVDDDGCPRHNGEELQPLEMEPFVPGDRYLCVTSNLHKRYQLSFNGKIRGLGSTAYHIALVARGSAYAAIAGYSKIWDMAGAVTLLNKVGGTLLDLSGQHQPLRSLLTPNLRKGPFIATTKSRFDSGEFTITLKDMKSKG